MQNLTLHLYENFNSPKKCKPYKGFLDQSLKYNNKGELCL